MNSPYLPRTLEAFIAKASRQFPVLMLSGPRQVGKTTLLKALCGEGSATQGRRYVSLDNPTLLALARAEPALFLQRFPAPLLIDEIQYAPGLFPLIKEAVDAQGGKGLYWLTGSQPFHLMQNVTESLAGRVAVMHLQGLSVSESLGQGVGVAPFTPGSPPGKLGALADSPLTWLYQRIWSGSFPAMYATAEEQADRDLFFGSYEPLAKLKT